jgi:hypothetical protein
MNELSLNMSMSMSVNYALEATYRNEGLSVGADHMVRYSEIPRVLGGINYDLFLYFRFDCSFDTQAFIW